MFIRVKVKMPQRFILNKKKGFTLIEVIVVIAMITTIFGYSFMSLSSFSRNKNDMDVKAFGNTLMNFIVNSKEYCKDKNQSGYIYFIPDKNKMIFSCNSSLINSLYLPSGFEGLNINIKGSRIFIDNKGFTPDACTITFRDRKGGLHYATICVGSSYVDFKN